jgi:peptidoglycan/xylan/chitin deacetylase (PgdA/CDA1 family)
MSTSQAIPVLMYHHVSPNPGLVTVSPQTFELQMQSLVEKGYSALTADQFLGFLQGRNEVPARSVLITFDDGYLDNYVYAYPAMQRLGLHGVIFAITGWIGEGTERPHAGAAPAEALPACPSHRDCMKAIENGQADQVMLRWSEIQAMEASGTFEIQSHTHTHTRWDKILDNPAERLSALENDLALSFATLQQRLNSERRHLCWPQGYFEPAYQTVAQQQGFSALYTVIKGMNTTGTSPQSIFRTVIKDRAGAWFTRRLWIYSHAWLGRLYVRLRGN